MGRRGCPGKMVWVWYWYGIVDSGMVLVWYGWYSMVLSHGIGMVWSRAEWRNGIGNGVVGIVWYCLMVLVWYGW